MEVLIEDYDAHQPVIDLMFPVIERYEEVEQFSEFNQAIEKLEPGIAMLRVIIEQHQLTLSDFKEEIGAQSTVSIILSRKRSLTLNHIKALMANYYWPRAERPSNMNAKKTGLTVLHYCSARLRCKRGISSD